jgi:hypothetical protein
MTPVAVEAFAPVLELLGPPLTRARSSTRELSEVR